MTAPYRVVVTSSLYNLGQKQLTRAMRQIGQRLAASPRSVGDPMFHLRTMQLEVRNLIHASLYIEYGVYEPESLVIIRSVTSFRGQVE